MCQLERQTVRNWPFILRYGSAARRLLRMVSRDARPAAQLDR